jgi:polysaccharide biosynthesis PFTS motif protein
VSILREKTGLNLKPSHLLYYFVEYCVWTEVNFNSKIQFITTLSAYKNLPIVFYLRKKNFERHMMWYSVNTIPIFKIGEKEPKMVLPQSLANYIDLHLVWNNYQVGFLEKQNIHNSKAYGSMLFYPKKVQENFNKNSSLIYFDVIPQHLIEKNSFYSNEMALCNLEGIISVINEFNDKFGKNLKLRIKHKRLPNKQHSAIYLNKVKNLISCGVIENVSPTENLYTLINDSKFVIAPPFTSPVFIAKELGVDCSFVYLGRTEYLIPDYFNEILVIKDKNNLLNKLVEFI